MNGTLYLTSHLYVNLTTGKTTKKHQFFWEQLQILHSGMVTGMLESFLAFTMEHTRVLGPSHDMILVQNNSDEL